MAFLTTSEPVNAGNSIRKLTDASSFLENLSKNYVFTANATFHIGQNILPILAGEIKDFLVGVKIHGAIKIENWVLCTEEQMNGEFKGHIYICGFCGNSRYTFNEFNDLAKFDISTAEGLNARNVYIDHIFVNWAIDHILSAFYPKGFDFGDGMYEGKKMYKQFMRKPIIVPNNVRVPEFMEKNLHLR